MNNLLKVLTGILGVLAVIACLATIGIIGYSMTGADDKNNKTENKVEATMPPQAEATPEVTPEAETGNEKEPSSLEGHVHDYEETIDQKATCYQAGRLKYTCECGDYYYLDVASTGHVSDDWEVERTPSKGSDGLRVRRCIYCDEIVAQETIPYENEQLSENEKHTHQYIANVEREPSCILAGLRKYTCSCGSFYTERIPAMGHVASDWTEVEQATTTTLGREQITCTVCGVVLDSRAVDTVKASASPAATQVATASPAATASATAAATATPTATSHSHSYTSYVLKEPTCKDKGIRSFVCSCGSSYAEVIEPDPNKHSYRTTVVPATATTPGYTIYTCIFCNDTFNDNYTTN